MHFYGREVNVSVRLTGKNGMSTGILTFTADCIKIAQVCG